MKTESQENMILGWLQMVGEITPAEALGLCGCFRLGARIYDLKRKGHRIVTTMVKVETRDGRTARVASYSLEGRR